MTSTTQEPVGEATFEDRSPVTGQSVGSYAAMTPDEALDMASAAAEAQIGWAATSFVDRRRILLAAADDLEENIESHVESMALEIGSTRPWAEMNVNEAAATLREAAGLTSTPIGQILPSATPGTVNHSLHRPAGVSLSIVPWNAPVILSARASVISLAVGNVVIIRPSEEAPRAAGIILQEALQRAGLPTGVLSVVTTRVGDGRDVINALIDSPEVRRVAFIGSTTVGRVIASRAGAALTPAVMELGGKNATIVRRDADLEAWAPQLAFASFANSGQVCMCTDRILVHRDRYRETVDRLAAIADGMTVGDPRQAGTDLGPVITDRAADRFRELISDARAHGADVAAGGQLTDRYARPTVLTDLDPSSRFAVEEGFLPIVEVIPFGDDLDAITIANSLEEGLIGSVISADRDAAYSLARELRAGAVHVNGPSIGDEPHVPFGGLGASGMGRLGGADSVAFFTDQRTLYVH